MIRIFLLCLVASSCSDNLERYLISTEFKRVCISGVTYLVFQRGVTVQYDRNGSVLKCSTAQEKKLGEEIYKEFGGEGGRDQRRR